VQSEQKRDDKATMSLLSSPVPGLLCPMPLCCGHGVSVCWAGNSAFSFFFSFAAEYKKKKKQDSSLPGLLLVFLLISERLAAGAAGL